MRVYVHMLYIYIYLHIPYVHFTIFLGVDVTFQKRVTYCLLKKYGCVPNLWERA